MGYRYLYLVRHGQYHVAQRDHGLLTIAGEEQARLTAMALETIRLSAIHHSPIYRAAQTAQIIAESQPHADLCPSDLLRECIPSIPERFAGLFATLGAETSAEQLTRCAERLIQAAAHYFVPPPGEEDVREMLVSHGNVIRFLVSYVLNMGPDSWANMLINNCGITRLVIDPGGAVFLVSHNDIGHLPDALRTDN